MTTESPDIEELRAEVIRLERRVETLEHPAFKHRQGLKPADTVLQDMWERLLAAEEKLAHADLPKFMTAKQVADLVGIAEGVFYEWKRLGDSPPAVHFTQRTVRYERDAVLKWAKDKEVGAGV